MQKSYTFGLNAEPLQNPSATDFEVLVNKAGSTQNHNPYGTSYFNNPAMMAMTSGSDRVTSIPSPYARMHITDIAFREMMAGSGVLNSTAQQAHFNEMSGDYLRAMSHCLDIYEMLFHFTDLDLIDKGITVKKIDLVTLNDNRYQKLLQDNAHLRSFVETLDLFRESYMRTIRDKAPRNYKFDFTQLYIFKYRGKTFAATSPFTGFFAKADCDLSNVNLSVTWQFGNQKKTHELLTNTPNEWLSIKDRDPEFINFLYLLLHDSQLDKVFTHLYAAVEACVPNLANLQNVSFAQQYPQFNFNSMVLPQIAGNTQNVSYIRPDGLDSSYLEYLLYLREPVDLSISAEAYATSIQNRVFPEGSNNLVPWIGVNDFLSDALIILPYDINDNYYAISYEDENFKLHRRCLLPLKRQALEYLDIATVANQLYIKKYSREHYSVTLTLNLTTGGTVELRRDYYDIDDDNYAFPNGALKDLQDDDRHFAFGIYPFVRSDKFENIYKVLFYNDFKWPEGFNPKTDDKLYDLSFYYLDAQNRATKYDPRTSIKENQSNKADNFFGVNTHYYHVANSTQVEDKYISINFAELSLTLVKNPKSGNPELVTATAIIAPVYHEVAYNPGTTNIAVDLGTSNTFIAYQHQGENVREISTIHQQPDWNEFTLMNCTCNDPSANNDNRDDLYLRTTDDANKNADDLCLPAQLCEFIPTRIKQSSDVKEHGYHFPIPSIINNLRINGQTQNGFNDRIALVHSAIPFAYYTIGKRQDNPANHYDAISTGQFKWFYGMDDYGIYNFNQVRQADFEAFLRELMFIVRSHMLCRGIDLDQCTLLWTYPLSFQLPLVDQYKASWNKVYCQYFNPSLLDTYGNVINPLALGAVVKYTNESRSPIYECISNPALTNHLTVLMDIGGGSTDVIGYKKNQPQFITSFGFAGNALYLGGSMNHSAQSNNGNAVQNYMRGFVKQIIGQQFHSSSNLNGTHPIDSDADINTLMNYGFTQDPKNFTAMFNSAPLQFMLQLHNAALIYHTAQLCKLESPDETPVSIFLTGNGSKLFLLNRNYTSLFNDIVSKVYGKDAKISISSPNDPKAATAYGSLKGCLMDGPTALQFNENSTSSQVVMLGDDSTIFEMDNQNGSAQVAGSQDELLRQVKKNVQNFIHLFFECYKGQAPIFTEEEVLEKLDFGTDNDSKLNFGSTLSDSMFFQYISLLMEQLSISICQKYHL